MYFNISGVPATSTTGMLVADAMGDDTHLKLSGSLYMKELTRENKTGVTETEKAGVVGTCCTGMQTS